MIFAIIFVVASCIASIQCNDDCVNRKCPPVPKHYEELGCKGIKEAGDCCETRFECSDFAKSDPTKCHIMGKVYNAGDKVDNNVVPGILADCTCQTHPARLSCSLAEERCREFNIKGCLWIYSDFRGCRRKQICGESKIAKLAKCHVEGKVYHSGQRFVPESQPCYNCLCTDDYDNTTAVAENVKCTKLNCGTGIFRLEDVKSKGCVPIYEAHECCPLSYRCPTHADRLMESDIVDNFVGPTCTFGNLTLRIGEQLETDADRCTQCKCTIPPMITCTKQPDC